MIEAGSCDSGNVWLHGEFAVEEYAKLDGWMMSSPTWILWSSGGIFFRFAAEPNHMTSIFPVLSWRRLDAHQSFTADALHSFQVLQQ
jgi:hypothetical protein